MLGVIFLKDESNAINKLLKLNSVHKRKINEKFMGIYICFNNINSEKDEKKFINKIITKIKKSNIDSIIIQKDIYSKSELLIKKLIENGINIVTGNKLYEDNFDNIINYIFENNKNIILAETNIGILINKITYKRLEYIKRLSENIKSMTIITEDKLKFENTCKNIFETQGLSIKLSDNIKNGLRGCNLIVNFDIDTRKICENIPNNCIFINFSNSIEKLKKSFIGIMINDIKLVLNKENAGDLYECFDISKFRNLAVAEAIIDKNDKGIIDCLVGQKGDIPIDDIKKFNIIRKNKASKAKKNKK